MKDFLFYTPAASGVDWKRIDSLRHVMGKRAASTCSQRTLLYTQSFQESEGEPYITRKAKVFAHALAHIDIYVQPHSLIFGNQASANFVVPIFPEYSIQWVIDELKTSDQRSGDVFQISREVKRDLKRITSYWLQHTHGDEVSTHLSESIRPAEKQGVLHRGGISVSGDDRIVPDHEMLLQRGLCSIADEAKRALTSTDLQDAQHNYYQAVIISPEGALLFFQHFAKLTKEMAEHEQDEKRRQELWITAHIAGAMMEQGARSFYEGVEVCYMMHVPQMIESNEHSFCCGRFDQYVQKLYEQDTERGVLIKGQILEIITHIFIMNSPCSKACPYGHTKYLQGYPLYPNLVVGGKAPQGSDGTNELSYPCIEAMRLASLAEPNFSVRYHLETPRQFLKAAALLVHTECGMPSMSNDEVAAEGIKGLTIPKRDALDYCPIGCVETEVPGKCGHQATGMTYVNWGEVLEVLLHNGVDPIDGIQMLSINGQGGDAATFESYEKLWQGWEKLLKFYSGISAECGAIYDDSLVKYDADPFVSCFIQDPMKLGETLEEGDCHYDVISQSNIGPCVVGDVLYVIKKLVFEGRLAAWGELMTAMQDNQQSLESAKIHKRICHVAKFRNGDDAVDEIVKDIFDSYLKLLPQYRTQRYRQGSAVSCYTMSTSNITSYIPNGFVVGAAPDGRFTGTPLSGGCSPTQGTDTNSPTAVINSVAKLPNEQMAAGQLLSVRFSSGALVREENLDKFVDFLITPAKKRIYRDQFSVIDSATLRLTQERPQDYIDLIMCVTGYCAQFVSLVPEAQEATIVHTGNTWQSFTCRPYSAIPRETTLEYGPPCF